MTSRQKEFARHYAAGLPAYQAAIAAGYARSTAERNAATMLQSPAIAGAVHRRRQVRTVFCRQDLDLARRQLNDIIAHSPDEKNRLAAIDKLAALMRLHDRLTHRSQSLLDTPIIPDKIEAQPADDHHITDPDFITASNPGTSENLPSAPEYDLLENGSPAFDVRVAPQKPLPPKPEPIEIRVVDYMGK